MERDLQDSELYEERFGYREQRSTNRFYAFAFLFLFLVLLFRLYWTSNYGGVQVEGSSMYDTLESGERLLMRFCDGEDADYGDVIVVHVGDYPEFDDGTEYLIKRLIAKEYDHVRCTDGQIEILYGGKGAWTKLDEPYAYYTDKPAYDFGEYVVGEGEIFFLGDNRNISQDSRFDQIGGSRLDSLYKASDVIGVVPDWAIKYRNVFGKIFFR